MNDIPPLPRRSFQLPDEPVEEAPARPGTEAPAAGTWPESRPLGVFSTRDTGKGKTFWGVDQTGPTTFSARTLDPDGRPTGLPMPLTREEFLRRFEPEVEYFGQRILPGLGAAAHGDPFRSPGGDAPAARLHAEETGIRALFELGLLYLDGREEDRCRTVFRDLARLKAPLRPVHKHLFNEFGIRLRKRRLYDEALELYGRAAELAQDDEHVHFNMARTAYDKGDWTGCVKHLTDCLERNPRVPQARRFCLHLVGRDEEKTARLEKTHPNMARIIMAESRKLLDRLLEAADIPAREAEGQRARIRERTEGARPEARSEARPRPGMRLAKSGGKTAHSSQMR